jgi:hypothetical protein
LDHQAVTALLHFLISLFPLIYLYNASKKVSINYLETLSSRTGESELDYSSSTSADASSALSEKRYTHHQYFNSSLRSVVSKSDNVVTIIPGASTESILRKAVSTVVKTSGNKGMSLKEYEKVVDDIVKENCVTVDVMFNETIGKRYLLTKKEAEQTDKVIPMTQKELDSFNKTSTVAGK